MFAKAKGSSCKKNEDQSTNNQQTENTHSDTGSDESESARDPGVAYWEAVRGSNGTAALGQGMARWLLDAKGLT